MLAPLSAPYVDARVDDLTFALGLPRLPALARREVRLGETVLELRVLGSSHQVLMAEPEPYSETVACLPGTDGTLPASHEAKYDALWYRFASEVRRLNDTDFTTRVRELTHTAEEHPGGLVAVFPGSSLAVTAITAERTDDFVGWHTWHAYPNVRSIVATTTRLEPR